MSGEFRATTRIVKDFDKNQWRELRRRAQLNDTRIKVGVPAGKYHKTKDEKTGKLKAVSKKAKASGTAILIALIGYVHEFGSPKRGIPARPWLRPGIRSGKADYVKLNRRNLVRVLNGQMTKEQALKQLGAMAVGKVQQYIKKSENFKPLKDATIKRKKSSAPLIDTGQLWQSIKFELTKDTKP